MKKMTRIVFTGILMLYTMIGFTQNNRIPYVLQVDKTSSLIMHTYAKGVQIYVCKQDPSDTSHYIWVFTEPRADLYTDSLHRQLIGKHYFDQEQHATWENVDGSKVTGVKVAQVNSPDNKAIPWLLLKASTTQGTGVLKPAAFIQRVFTNGGKAPASADKSQKGKTVEIPYTAEYLFYSGK